MSKKISLFLLVFVFISGPILSFAEDVKVVPIGQTIQPEGGAPAEVQVGKAAAKKKKPKAVVVPAGKSFSIQMATALSSGLTKTGEVVYFRAAEDVGPAKNPIIKTGAIGEGGVKEVDQNKKKGKLVVEFQKVEGANGEDIEVNGTVEVEGKGTHAAIAVGDPFTATLEDKVIVKGKHKKQDSPSFKQTASIEINGKGVRADIRKGEAKGKVQLILEPPQGLSIEDIDDGQIALYRVNDFLLPAEVMAQPEKGKGGDKNKNGVQDLVYDFDAWYFIRYQPRGENTIYIKGKLRDGTPFSASTKVKIDY